MSELPFAGAVRWLRYHTFKVTLPRVCAFLLLATTAAVYVPYLGNPLVFDDFGVNYLYHGVNVSFAPRWLPYATLGFTYVMAEGEVWAMRLGNLVLHAINAVMVFALLREVFLSTINAPGGEMGRASRTLMPAMLAALVFAAHPVAVYGTGYLVQRTILMSTLFMLVMLICYWRWLITGRRAMWVWSVTGYLLSVFSKEHSVMAPAVALAMTFLLYRPSISLAHRITPIFVAYTIIAVLVMGMVKGVFGTAYEPYARELMGNPLVLDEARMRDLHFMSIITQSLLYFKYAFLWVFPNLNWMSIDVREPLAEAITLWPYWAGTVLFLVYPVLALRMILRGGRVGVAGWVLSYPWIMFATEFSTIRIQEPFVMYRSYLWFPIFGALFALALYRLNTRVLIVLSVVMACVLVPLSWNRLYSMSDALVLWEDAARLLVSGNELGAGRIYYNRALALSEKGRKAEAEADLDRVIILHPRFAPVYYARANVRFELARHADAMQDLEEAIALNPDSAGYYLARAKVLTRMGRGEQAVPDLQKSCEMKDVIACYALSQQGRTK